MRPPNNSSTAGGTNSTANVDGGLRHWNSPIPYLFGTVALMLGLITVALVILVCSFRKSSPAPNSGRDIANSAQEKPAVQVDSVVDSDEPKIVVIMAGDDRPTCLAMPSVVRSIRLDHHGDHDHQQPAV